MTEEQILELASQFLEEGEHTDDGYCASDWFADTENLLKFARAIIEEHEKDREHNLGKDEYFNSWRN